MKKTSKNAVNSKREDKATEINKVNAAVKTIAQRLKERAELEEKAREEVRAENKVVANVGKTSRVDFIMYLIWKADGDYITTPDIIKSVDMGYGAAITETLMEDKLNDDGSIKKKGLPLDEATKEATRRILEDVNFKLRKWNIFKNDVEIAKSVQWLEKDKSIMLDDVISVKPVYNRISWSKESAKEQGFDFADKEEHMENILKYGIDAATEMLHKS